MAVDMFPVDDIPEDLEDLENDVTSAVAPFGRAQTEDVVSKPAMYRSYTQIVPEPVLKASTRSKDNLSNLLTRDQSAKLRKSSNDGRELRRVQRERPKTSSCVRCVTQGER